MQLPYDGVQFYHWFSPEQEIVISWILYFAEADMKIAVLKNKAKLLKITGKLFHRLQACNFTETRLF